MSLANVQHLLLRPTPRPSCHPSPPCRVKSGRGSGTIGQLTGGLLTRQDSYEHAALCALVPLLNPQLYPDFAGLLQSVAAAASQD